MTPEQFLQRVKEEAERANRLEDYDPGPAWEHISRTNVPRLVRWVELQRAVIAALSELSQLPGFANERRLKALDRRDEAEQALAAFEKEMENWT